ncbi:restriction endonuclease [Deinococcus ficus]
MAKIFECLGYQVKVTPGSNDFGRDLILVKQGETTIVECKHHIGNIGRPVVQKLHSATDTHPTAYRAILVSTSGFTPGAREYVDLLHKQGKIDIELWDFKKLVSIAQSVNISLLSKARGHHTAMVMPARTQEQLQRTVTTQVMKLASHPRQLERELVLGDFQTKYVAGALITYRVDKRFSVSERSLYHAHELGTELVFDNATPAEKTYWIQGDFQREQSESFGVIPAIAELVDVVDRHLPTVQRQVARRLSKKVSYTGRNNRQYEKECVVSPQDVRASGVGVLTARQRGVFKIGPQKYVLHYADDRARVPLLTSTEGFRFGPEGLQRGDGSVCNDCASITSKRHSRRCQSCHRTLCPAHIWKLPRRFPLRWVGLCSDCYVNARCREEHLEPQGALRPVALHGVLALIPGLPFLLANRQWEAAALILGPATFLLGTWRLGLPMAVAYMVLLATNLFAFLFWRIRIAWHARNVRRLTTYTPAWTSESIR